MKTGMIKRVALLCILAAVCSAALPGCGRSGGEAAAQSAASGAASETSGTVRDATAPSEEPESSDAPEDGGNSSEGDLAGAPAGAPEPEASVPGPAAPDAAVSAPAAAGPSGSDALSDTTLEVRFGDGGDAFTLHLYDNETAAAIAGYVGTADWRLPIYHYDDYENWEIMQYYDIPGRYEIPSNPQSIASEKAGEVYYSAPNRIILFYGDGEVPGEYTPVGSIDYSQDLVDAVENNPVVEGWGNKIIHISE